MAWQFICSFLISKPKEILNNSQIIIHVTCASRAKVNLDVTNAFNHL